MMNVPHTFKPERLKAANISLKEAQFLYWIFMEERTNAEVFTEFGGGFGYQVLRHGYASNPLGEQGVVHTNLWKLTQAGLEKLNEVIGEKSL